jgi:hypothetical protein
VVHAYKLAESHGRDMAISYDTLSTLSTNRIVRMENYREYCGDCKVSRKETMSEYE